MPAKHSKRFRAAVDELEDERFYTPAEAVELVKKTASAKFDETVEIHLRTNADPRHADQLVRGTTLLPHGLGRPVRVLVFAQGDAARTALESGADYAGADELVEKVEGGWVEFDVAMATQDMMGKIGKLGRVLGRRGLMPNPRSNTVVQPQAVTKLVEKLRTQKHITVHHEEIPRANHFFENEQKELMASVDNYLDFRLDPSCPIK